MTSTSATIKVIRPGLLTTIQDLGRLRMQQYGVIVSGVMDPLAARIANLLVGNEQSEAILEVTLMGPSLLFESDSLIAITGGDLSPIINGQPIPAWRPVWVRGGSRLEFGAPVHGCRACLAIAGGFDVPIVMHSQSTYLRAELGGFQGRSLEAGDILKLKWPSTQSSKKMRQMSNLAGGRSTVATSWFAGADVPGYSADPIVRVIPGNQFDWFTDASQMSLVTDEFSVTPQSDRMGYRLAGPPLQFRASRELVSEAVTMGTIQVPADGQPIILMADRPTTGGYAKIGQVASVDFPLLAQVRPGSKIRFQFITVDEAQDLYRAREATIKRLRCGIRLNQ